MARECSASWAPGLPRLTLFAISALLLFADWVCAARILEPSSALSDPLSFVPRVQIAKPQVAAVVPRFNIGGPCLAPKGQNASLTYSGKGLRGKDTITASSLTLNGVKCGSPGGPKHWQIREQAATAEELQNVDKAFKFFASISSDPTRSSLRWLYAAEADGQGIVQCGTGRGIAKILLLRTSNQGNPAAMKGRGNKLSIPKGRLIMILDARDNAGKSYTCNFQQSGVSGQKKKTSGSDTGASAEPSRAPTNSGADDSRESSGGNLSGGEIGGIVAGGAGVVFAIAVVTVAAILWQRQRNREEVDALEEDEEEDVEQK